MIAGSVWIIDTSGIGVEFTTETGYPPKAYINCLDVAVTAITNYKKWLNLEATLSPAFCSSSLATFLVLRPYGECTAAMSR